MKHSLPLLLLLGLTFGWGASALAAPSPDEQRLKHEARFEALIKKPGVSARQKVKLAYPTKENDGKWLPAATFLGHEIEHSRSAGGNFVLRAIAPTRDGPHTRFAAIIRFQDRVPVNALSKDERAHAEQNWKRVTEDGSVYFLQPKSQVDEGRFFKDEKTGKLLVKIVTWGAIWRIHERAYEVEMVLLP